MATKEINTPIAETKTKNGKVTPINGLNGAVNGSSDYTAESIKVMGGMKEVRKLVNKSYNTAKQVLSENRDTLEKIAHALIEREVLDANEIEMLVDGQELPPLQAPPSKPEEGVQHVIKPELQPGRAPTPGERQATA
jgi:hypothetical protein